MCGLTPPAAKTLLTAATSFFMKMLYADSARGASCGSFGSAAFRLRLRFAPAGAAWCASAVGWICTANTALHCEHCDACTRDASAAPLCQNKRNV